MTVQPQATSWEMSLQPQADGRVIAEFHTVIGKLIFQVDNADLAENIGKAWIEAARTARTGLATPRSPLFLPNGQPHIPGAPGP